LLSRPFLQIGGATTLSANWSTSGLGAQDLSKDSGYWADAQIAASESHVVVTQRASIGYFTKEGTQLVHTNGNTLFSGLLPAHPDGAVFDLRPGWDRYRSRIWIVGLVNSKTAGAGLLLVAVSKTEDPRDGFYTYSFHGPAPGFSGNVDYPSVGVSADAL